MIFEYSHSRPDEGIIDAISFANELSHMEAFWEEIVAEARPFTYTTVSAVDLASRLRACETPIRVHHYTHSNPNSSTTAVTDPGRPFQMFFNDRKLNRSVGSKANTLIHEFVHNVDFFADGNSSRQWNYTHPEEPTRDRPQSAPYWIGNLAQRWYNFVHQHDPNWRALTPWKDYAEDDTLTCEILRLSDDQIDLR